MEVELATSIGQQGTLNLLPSYNPNPKLPVRIWSFTMTLQEEKKNHFRHLNPKFRNQMQHSSWSLFPS